MSEPSSQYKDTIFLPETTFPMRGNLSQNEPIRLNQWEEAGIYEQVVAKRKADGCPKFILHDGPPFANGDAHMGTALNKVLKDFVVKSKSMAGYYAPFIPGWDCHGLPIEFKVIQEARDESPAEIRVRCEEFAKGWINIQSESFRRLGVFADWDNKYLTMNPSYEAGIIRTFAKLIERGAVYQSKKPVQWSYGAQTALAEAEVEYMDKKSIALFVGFPAVDSDYKVVIWTTTPWTLPANLAVAVHEKFNYVYGEFSKEVQYKDEDGNKATKTVTDILLIAQALLEEFKGKTGFAPTGELTEVKGADLLGKKVNHPFLDRNVPIIGADFVTTESGTGLVHIAPGHGADDYMAGQTNGLGVLSPVDDFGKYTEECGVEEFVGEHVFDCNVPIIKILAKEGHLIGKENYHHSYPHCWRSKTPIIFRAVDQFFISMDESGIRKTALSEIKNTEWLPSWGENRIYGTVEGRPDWCISRQRTWGVPLPIFFDEEGEPVVDSEIALKVAELVAEKGTNVWFTMSDAEITDRLGLPSTYTKGKDTLDVWIDSGSSHVSVLDQEEELSAPADLYLEATDQHRGWFQSSLMLSCAVRDVAPYKTVMTHGFVVNQDGSKISKSKQGEKGKDGKPKKVKPTEASYFYEKYGADILRLWVSSVDWQDSVPFGEDLFKQITDPYRRIRNTFKILLGNLNGFEVEKDGLPLSEITAENAETLIDRWILERLNTVIAESKTGYEAYDFRKVFTTINQFVTSDLSAIYIEMTKDRVYCDAKDSTRRRASLTVMNHIFESLVRLLAPVLSYTAEEAWEHAGHDLKTDSIHLQTFPDQLDLGEDQAQEKVADLLKLRSIIQTANEEKVQAKEFTKNNEAHVTLTIPDSYSHRDLLSQRDFYTEFFIIAELDLVLGTEVTASSVKTTYEMCPRCRRYEPSDSPDGLCERCAPLV